MQGGPAEEFSYADILASYRLMIHRRNGARTEANWLRYEAVAQQLRDKWFEQTGENTLHRMAFGKPDDGQWLG